MHQMHNDERRCVLVESDRNAAPRAMILGRAKWCPPDRKEDLAPSRGMNGLAPEFVGYRDKRKNVNQELLVCFSSVLEANLVCI